MGDNGILTDVAGPGMHKMLSNEQYRRIISILEDAAAPLALADIAIELAEREGLNDEAKWDRAQKLRIELYHRHIPKLKDVGVVKYDSEQLTAVISSNHSNSTLRTKVLSS